MSRENENKTPGSYYERPFLSDASKDEIRKKRILLSLVIIIASFIVFNIAGYNNFMSSETKLIVRLILSLFLLSLVLGARKVVGLGSYQYLIDAFFLVSLSFVVVWFFNVEIPIIVKDSVEGWTVYKLLEAVPIIVIILLGIRFRGMDVGFLYLQKGKLKLSLMTGLIYAPMALLQFAAVTMLSFSTDINTLLAWTPWFLTFAFANSIMEELMFRGLFLRAFNFYFEPKWAIGLSALIFGIFHAISIQFLGIPLMIAFFCFTIILGALCGYIMWKTGSIAGAIIAHAIADIFFIVAAFA